MTSAYATLFLGIVETGEVYEVSPLDPHPDVAEQAWRLRKVQGGAVYDLTLSNGFWSCECGDFVARKQDRGQFCKHLLSAADRGLLGRRTK